MTEMDGAIKAAELRTRLPDGWRIEGNGSGVYGYADESKTAEVQGSGKVPACFCICPDGSLWRAVWKVPHELGDNLHSVSDQVTGTRERCVEWVAQKAHNPEECCRE